jgi:hypothetical protein
VIEDCVERLELTENRRGRADFGLSDRVGCWDNCLVDLEPETEVDTGSVSTGKDGTVAFGKDGAVASGKDETVASGSVGGNGLFDTVADFLSDCNDDRDCSTGIMDVE